MSRMGAAADIEVSEVGTRDGLQNIDRIMPTAAKKAWITAEAARWRTGNRGGLLRAGQAAAAIGGHRRVGAFAKTLPGLKVAVLVPNLRGAKTAIGCGVDKMSIPFSVSETHSQANLNKTHAQMLEQIALIVEALVGAAGGGAAEI